MKLFCKIRRFYSRGGKISTQMEEKDFEEIYEGTYLSTLKFITIHCYHVSDINDILQDTYVELYKILCKKRKLKVENKQSYICGIARNVIKRYGAKKKDVISLANDEKEEIEVADTFDLEQNFMHKQDVQKVWEFIQKKDLVTSKIFYLYFVLGLKIMEIAQELTLNESTVKNKIYRTQKEIQKQLGKDVIGNDE